jgi:hypothetical protein
LMIQMLLFRARLFAVPMFFLLVLLGLPRSTFAEDQTYNQPRWFDDRLDWCLTWATDCGKAAADNFCKRRRFFGASNFAAEPGVGRTRVSGTNQVCEGSFCTGFKFITCAGRVPPDQVKADPVWKGHRLDACLTWATNCGKPAADAYCRKQGYTESFYSVLDPEPGRSTTRLIGTDQICSASFCTGFQMILCQ